MKLKNEYTFDAWAENTDRNGNAGRKKMGSMLGVRKLVVEHAKYPTPLQLKLEE